MTKKQLVLLASCMLIGTIILISLFNFSSINEEIPRSSFTRTFATVNTVKKLGEINLSVNSFYVAGATRNTVYLGNWTGPYHLVAIGIPKLDTMHFNVTVKGIDVPADFKTFRMKVDSPNFYLTHGVMPGVFKGSLSRREATAFIPAAATPYFVDAIPVTSNLITLRSLSTESKAYELAKLKPDSPYFEFKPELLEKQVDGIFCEEGTLHYSKDLNRLVYLYSYRNEFFTMDTTLTLIHRFHTIDTFTRAHIKVAHVASKNYSTLASPPARTNGISSAFGTHLYVQSVFLAKNENKNKFDEASAIDVYDLTNGRYIESFYLDNFKGKHPTSFTVTNNHIVAIYDHHLVLYEFNFSKN